MSLASIWLLNANGRVRVASVTVCRMHVTIAARRFLFYSFCVLHLDMPRLCWPGLARARTLMGRSATCSELVVQIVLRFVHSRVCLGRDEVGCPCSGLTELGSCDCIVYAATAAELAQP